MNDLRLEKINIRAVNVPLNKPVIAHLGTFEKWPFLCLDVHTNKGFIGKSYIGPYLVDQLPVIAKCIEALSKHFFNQNIKPFNFFEEGFKKTALLGYQGIGLYALAALDIAFWDVYAKAANMPLASLLGSDLKPIKTYNSRGLWLIPLDKVDEEIYDLLDNGSFNALKVRIGRDEIRDDIHVIEKIKKIGGDDITIMSDFNCCYEYDTALKRMLALDDIGLYWFEEPINYRNFDDCAKLSSNIKTPICIGENFHGPYDLVNSIKANASSYIMPDLMRIGGISGWLKSASIAEAHNLKFSTHLYPEVSAHLMNLTPTAHWLEWVDWANPILQDTGFRVENGQYFIPDIPGTGVEWNETNIEKYKVNI